jgi:hypothetical protein
MSSREHLFGRRQRASRSWIADIAVTPGIHDFVYRIRIAAVPELVKETLDNGFILI